jgi:3-oxoacyl-[acyl-carrier-protein] synthase-3
MRILGTGSAVPQGVLTNDILASVVDTSDEWITSRTGIHRRRFADDETAAALANKAAQAAIRSSGVPADKIAVVVCATLTHDVRCPSLACILQRDLALSNNIIAFDLNAACSGFIYGLIVAHGLLAPGQYALVVGSEVLSRHTDFTDRNTCVLFGDGAGAVVLGATGAGRFEWVARSQGDSEVLRVDEVIHMDGQAVFKFAVDTLVNGIPKVVEKAGVGLDEVELFVCHQANERILASAAKRLGVPFERFFCNLAEYGNTSAASVPLALDEAVRAGLLQTGTKLVLAGFGGGLTAGAIYMEWE